MNMTPSTNKLTQFRTLADELSKMIEYHGYAVRPYSTPLLPHFNGLDDAGQNSALQQISEYLQVCQRIYKTVPSSDEAQTVHNIFEFYGYEYNPQILDMIKIPGHVLEIYLPTHIQQFRSFDFYQLTSYTIEDVFCRRWMDLFLRDEHITTKIFEAASKVLTGQEDMQFVAEKHILKERATLERLEVLVHSLFITPLLKEGQIVALASVVRAEPA